MADMFEYLKWRGDISFSQLRPNPVDTLIFSALSYVDFSGIVSRELTPRVNFRDAVHTVLALPDAQKRCRVEEDLKLMEAAAETERFGTVELGYFQDILIPQEETQFAAITFFPGDGTAVLTFRGTDDTLVGWKEDFNMSFRESIPAQLLAVNYVKNFAENSTLPMWLAGHSKGGNLAVYAGAKSDSAIQSRIITVFNHDGPGFSGAMMQDPGYRAILPKVCSYVPQSSLVGVLLEQEAPYTVIKSRRLGVLQHEVYAWEIMGGDFIAAEGQTADTAFLDRTIKNWLSTMTVEERSDFVDTVYGLLTAENASTTRDLIRPQTIRGVLQNIKSDETVRNHLALRLSGLLQSAKQAQNGK